MESKKFTKLSELIGSEFTVKQSLGYKWKQWDPMNKKMLVSDSYQEGYRKMYSFETDKGLLDLGPGQVGSLLEGVFYDGRADVLNRTFSVKSNGKSGIDVRYYINPVRKAPPKPPQAPQSGFNDEVDVNSGFEDLPPDW